VIDLTRLPSNGRAVGVALRQYKATCAVPLVFAGGEAEKVRRTRELLPDATYTEWAGMGEALRRAVRVAPAAPARPGTMADYSGTPLAKKLRIKAGATVALLGAARGFARLLDGLPPGVRLVTRGTAGTTLLFVKSRADLGKRFPAAARQLAAGGALWIVWPKKTSGVACDLTQQAVRDFGMARDFVDYKISALDETWSGLCFARRTAKQPVAKTAP
jgi:hypothetical protein